MHAYSQMSNEVPASTHSKCDWNTITIQKISQKLSTLHYPTSPGVEY